MNIYLIFYELGALDHAKWGNRELDGLRYEKIKNVRNRNREIGKLEYDIGGRKRQSGEMGKWRFDGAIDYIA